LAFHCRPQLGLRAEHPALERSTEVCSTHRMQCVGLLKEDLAELSAPVRRKRTLLHAGQRLCSPLTAESKYPGARLRPLGAAKSLRHFQVQTLQSGLKTDYRCSLPKLAVHFELVASLQISWKELVRRWRGFWTTCLMSRSSMQVTVTNSQLLLVGMHLTSRFSRTRNHQQAEFLAQQRVSWRILDSDADCCRTKEAELCVCAQCWKHRIAEGGRHLKEGEPGACARTANQLQVTIRLWWLRRQLCPRAAGLAQARLVASKQQVDSASVLEFHWARHSPISAIVTNLICKE